MEPLPPRSNGGADPFTSTGNSHYDKTTVMTRKAQQGMRAHARMILLHRSPGDKKAEPAAGADALQQPSASMILEQIGVAHIRLQNVYRLVPGHVSHLEDGAPRSPQF